MKELKEILSVFSIILWFLCCVFGSSYLLHIMPNSWFIAWFGFALMISIFLVGSFLCILGGRIIWRLINDTST